MRNVLSLILGGGRGTRLYPLTQLRAKPAVPLGGKYRLIDIPVSNCINSGIQKIYVMTQFNSASLNRHISLTYQFSPFSEGFVEILAAQQTPEHSTWFQGTADAVRQYLSAIQAINIKEVLILSGDHLYRMDYRPFIEEHRSSGADVSISVVPVTKQKATDFGLLKIDNEGWVQQFSEKPKGQALETMRVDTTALGLDPAAAREAPFIASMGIYVFRRDALIELLSQDPEKQDFGKEIIPSAIEDYKIRAFLFNNYWEDIGTIQAFYQANMELLEFPNPRFSFYDVNAPIFTRQRFLPPSKILDSVIKKSLVCEGCIIEDSRIEHSVLGIRTRVEGETQIRDSLIMGADYFQSPETIAQDRKDGLPPVGIGQKTVIQNTIIDKNARIGKNCMIINKDQVQEGERPQEGIWIRNGLVIVTKNTSIPDGTVI